MFVVICVDEKWFYMTKNTKKYYLGMRNMKPYCKTRSKVFPTKTTILAAMVYHRYDRATSKHFNGKLGIRPFIIIETAKRNSRNHAAGTSLMKLKDIQ